MEVDVQKTAATELQRRPARVVEGRARLPQTAVGAQFVGVLVRDLLERLGADLLLALDKEPQRDRHLAQRFQRLHGVDARHHIGLIVRDAAREDPPIALGRLKGRRLPQVERIHGLDVVVLVQQQLAAAGAPHLGV